MKNHATTLNLLQLGQSAKVVELDMENAVSQRLLGLGLRPGTTVKIAQIAPLGDPVAVDFEDGRISLRRAEAAAIKVEPI